MKRFLIYLLQLLSRLILYKYKPMIIGITGSVGKTSTKEAVFAVLASKFSVRASPKNYNNELGAPLAIIGATSAPGKSLIKWCAIFLRALLVIVFPARYPAILILEMGADRPRDIAKLVKLALPQIGVITAVSRVHTEFLGNIKRVAVEKRRLVEAVPKQGTVILNMDDEIARGFADYADGKVMGYGIENEADVRGIEIQEQVGLPITDYGLRTTELGSVHFKIFHQGSVVPVHLPNVLGYSHIYAALAAAAVGQSLNMNMVEISTALLKYNPPPGRMRLITGVKNTLIIDDTYNSSPAAARAALETLERLTLPGNSKCYAVLGDMLELGQYNESGHREIGHLAADCADVVIGVGPNSAWIIEEARKAGMSEDKTFHFQTFDNTLEHFLQDRIQPGDIILIKGSQGLRLERLVNGLMAEPLRAKELLCRQGKEWKNRSPTPMK